MVGTPPIGASSPEVVTPWLLGYSRDLDFMTPRGIVVPGDRLGVGDIQVALGD